MGAGLPKKSLFKINQTTDNYDSDNESLVKRNNKKNSNMNNTSVLGGNHEMSFNNHNL